MSLLRSRLKALEARLRRQGHATDHHFTSIIRVPPDIPHDAWLDWLARQPCACGRAACPERRIGLLVPARLSPEQWTARYRPQPDKQFISNWRTDGV